MSKTGLPTHVAVILDGNRRWAKEKGLPTLEGHRRGFNRVIELGKKARDLGIKVFTVWAFSTENWNRTTEEKVYLMKLYEMAIEQNLKEALKNQIRIIHLGRKDRLPQTLIEKIRDAEERTKNFTKYYFCIGLDYGGRDEIVRAIEKNRTGEEKFDTWLDTKNLPQSDVDLVIRTGGEQRTSGFMIWQAAYAEYIFVKKFLPDYSAKDFQDSIHEYQQRQRRFGK